MNRFAEDRISRDIAISCVQEEIFGYEKFIYSEFYSTMNEIYAYFDFEEGNLDTVKENYNEIIHLVQEAWCWHFEIYFKEMAEHNHETSKR